MSEVKVKAKPMFDLSKNNLSATNEEGYEFELVMPGSGEGTGAFVKVRGEQSPTVRNYSKKKYNEYKMKQDAHKRRGKGDYEIDLDEAEEMAVDNAVNRVISWKNIAIDGKEVPFTKEAAQDILKNHSWIRDQVMEESSQAINFQPK